MPVLTCGKERKTGKWLYHQVISMDTLFPLSNKCQKKKCLHVLQAQQLQADADRQASQLKNSLKQAEGQSAALLLDKERLHAQLQHQQAAAADGPPVGAPVQTVPQVSQRLQLHVEAVAPALAVQTVPPVSRILQYRVDALVCAIADGDCQQWLLHMMHPCP